MSCLSEERFVEMLDGGGLETATEPEQAHLESCGACQDAWATVAAAGEVLGGSRPRGIGRFGRGFPILAAAAVLLAIVGIVLWRPGEVGRTKPPPTAEELVGDLVEGSDERSRAARDLLLGRGPEVLPALVACRKQHSSSARVRALQDLIFALKRARLPDDPETRAVLRKLETMTIDLKFEQARLEDVVAFVMDFSGLNVVLDPGLAEGIRTATMNLEVKGTPLREALDLVCTVRDLDFDLRYGVVLVSSPRRLWLGPGGDAAGVLPLNNHWADHPLEGKDKEVSDKLRAVRITLDMSNAPLSAIADYLKEISELRIEVAVEAAERSMSLRVADVRLEHAIELLTLPLGLDARIEGGTVRLAVPR